MNIQAVDLIIAAKGAPVEVFFHVRRAAPASPLKLHSVEQIAAGRWKCHFVPQREDLAIGYPSVLKLQEGISRELTILAVESHSEAVAA